MKLTIILVSWSAMWCHAQIATFSEPDTLTMERYWMDGYEVRNAVVETITNDGEDTLTVEVVEMSDTADFEWWGLVSPVPPHEHRMFVVGAKRTVGHDTSCRFLLLTNDIERGEWRSFVINGKASTRSDVREARAVTTTHPFVSDILGRPYPQGLPNRTGIYFVRDSILRKVVVVR